MVREGGMVLAMEVSGRVLVGFSLACACGMCLYSFVGCLSQKSNHDEHEQ